MLSAIAATYGFCRRKLSLRAAVLVYILFALAFVKAIEPRVLQLIEHKVFDFYQTVKPRAETNFPVVIADIDEASLKAFGQWPWPRTRLAELIDRLAQSGAIVIGFDVLFAERDRLSPPDFAQAFPNLSPAARNELLAMPGNDTVFANSIGKNRVVLGISGVLDEASDSSAGKLPAAKIATLGGNVRPFLFNYPGLGPLVDELAQAASGVGLVNVVSETDGIVRKSPALARVAGRNFLSFAMELLRVATGTPTTLVKLDTNGITGVVLAGVQLPTDRNGQFWIHFAGHNPKRFISIKDFFEGKVPVESIANKIVLVGTTSVGLYDLKTTPLDPAIPGVEIHAELIESVLSNALLIRPNFSIGLELMVLVSVGLFLIIFVQRLGAVFGVIIGGLIATFFIGLSWYLFSQHKFIIDFAIPMVANFILYFCIVIEKYYSEEKSKRAVRLAFAHYISPAMVNKLAESPDKLVLGGETRNISIMFSDIRQFTKISEGYAGDPQALTQLMNRFLSPLTDEILQTSGTIDKYIGDAIMAFWNAPLDDSDHAEHACLAALRMVDALTELNQQLEVEAKQAGRNFVALKAGIGINSGECVVGNLGSTQRFNYSALGDAVNLASRIEGLTKQYGVTILVGESTARLAPNLALAEVDLVRVVGKEIPVRIYALLGDRALKQSEIFQNFLQMYETALQSYRASDWADVNWALLQAEELTPAGLDLSGLFATYRARVQEYTTSPPPADWDGVYRAEKK